MKRLWIKRGFPWILLWAGLLQTVQAGGWQQLWQQVLELARQPVADRILRIDYTGFTLWLDCKKRGAQFFRYNAQHDTGHFKRYAKFFLDPDVPGLCQQRSSTSYRAPRGAPRYDRGHLVPANHLDYDRTAIRQSNFMTNILPQTAALNRGAWLRSEEIVECYRDYGELAVLGGPIWGRDPTDDFFIASHGVETPAAFWKVVIDGNRGRVLAWVMPNDISARKHAIDRFVVTVPQILRLLSNDLDPEALQDPDTRVFLRELQAVAQWPASTRSWPIPKNCDLG